MSLVTHPNYPATEEQKGNRTGRALILTLVVAAIAAGTFFMTRHDEKKKKPDKPPAPVTASVAKAADIPILLRSIGSVVPMNAVSVKSRVGGRIVSIHFNEGDTVQRKQLLFTIDPRPLRAEYLKAESDVLKQEAVIAQAKAAIDKDKASLAQVKADLTKNQALARLAQVNAERFGALARAGAVSEVEAERRETDRESTAAIVVAGEASIQNAQAQIMADKANLQNAYAQLASAKAALENARVQLNFTTVNSPISGRTGKILVLRGNNVRADEDILVTINQISPIYVEFSIPSEQFELVQKYSEDSLYATVALKGHDLVRKGRVTFTDNAVDNTTGTVKLHAEFDNADSVLWPGKYVDVVLTLTTLKNAITVPSQAVQTGQAGQFVWVLKDGKTAHMQPVKTGPTVDGITAISSGISNGDTIVTDGQIQLAEGSKVQVSGSQQ
jgi:multidrug efflux system membrane fusion protein